MAVLSLSRPRGFQGQVVFLSFCAVFLALYAAGLVLQPSETYLRLQSNLLYNVPGLVALVLVAARVRTASGRERWGWCFVAALLLSWQAGDWIYTYYDLGLNSEAPYPGVADLLYTAGYAAVLVALLLLAYPPGPAASLRWVMDVVLISTVAACFEWVLIIDPIVAEGGVGSWESMVALSYPVWDLALVVIVAGGIFAWHGNVTRRSALLLSAVSVLAITDTVYSVGVLDEAYDNLGNPLELGWVAFYLLIAVAALMPNQMEVARFDRRVPLVWLNIPFLLALPLPVVQAVRALNGDGVDVLSLGAAVVLLAAFASHIHASYMTTRALEDERRRARLDSLTGTLNHGGIIEEAQALIADKQGTRFSLCMVDVDGLKRMNDDYGHTVGDQALKVVASRLRRSGGIVGRYGGDEFLVLFEPHDYAEGRGPELLLTDALAGAFLQAGADNQLPVSASFGVARYRVDGRDLGGLIEHADAAMYEQKREKRRRVQALRTQPGAAGVAELPRQAV